MSSTASGPEAVDAYLAKVPPPEREALLVLRSTLREILPHAEEGIRYGMPAFSLGGKGVAGFTASKNHLTYFPMSGDVLEAAGDAVARFPTSKGGLRFEVGDRLPVSLVRRLVKLRLAELAAVTNGRCSEYYDDGQLKAVGPKKDGRLHGRWKWFRRDGTLMRTGQFSHGEQTGTWTTWDRDGNRVKRTTY